MNIPPISYISDRTIFRANPLKRSSSDRLWDRALRESVHGENLAIPKRKKVRTPFSSPEVSSVVSWGKDILKEDVKKYNNAYYSPMTVSKIDGSIALGGPERVFMFRRGPISEKMVVAAHFTWNGFVPVARWSDHTMGQLATLNYRNRGYEVEIYNVHHNKSINLWMPSVRPTILEWKDDRCIWVGDEFGELSLYDMRMKKAAQNDKVFETAEDMVRISTCANQIAMGFDSNQFVISDIRKPDKPLKSEKLILDKVKSYKINAAVLGLKFVKPDLLIAGGGKCDQRVRFFDPTESGDFTPYFTLKRMGQVSSIEVIGNQVLVGRGYSSDAIHFYRHRGKIMHPESIGSLKKINNSERTIQIVSGKEQEKAFCLTADSSEIRIDEITLPKIVTKPQRTKRRKRQFSGTDIR